MTKNSILIASLLGLTALGGAAVAQDTGYDEGFTMEEQAPQRGMQQARQAARSQRGPMARGGGQRGAQRMMQQLNLSSEQQALLREGRQSFEPKAKKLRAQMRALQQQRAELLQAGDFEGLHRLIDKQAKLKAKMHHQRLRSMSDFHESLSPQQLQSLQQALAKKKKSKAGRGGQRGQRGGARGAGQRGNSRPAPSFDSGWDE